MIITAHSMMENMQKSSVPAQSTHVGDCHCSSCLLANLTPTLRDSLLLQEDGIPSIQLQLQEVKRGKNSQFFGLMGKQVGGE